MSDRTLEDFALTLSRYGYATTAVAGLVFAGLTGSGAILLDGAYSLVSFLMVLLARRVAHLVEQPDSEDFQFGYAYFEPLLNSIRGLLILVLVAFGVGCRLHSRRPMDPGTCRRTDGVAVGMNDPMGPTSHSALASFGSRLSGRVPRRAGATATCCRWSGPLAAVSRFVIQRGLGNQCSGRTSVVDQHRPTTAAGIGLRPWSSRAAAGILASTTGSTSEMCQTPCRVLLATV